MAVFVAAMKDLLKQAFFLLVIAFILAVTINHFSPRGIPLIGQWDTDVGVVTADTDLAALWAEFEVPDVATAKRVFDSGKALFVDVRNRGLYDEGHIPAAVSLPLGDLETRLDAVFADVPRQRPIVTYCSGRLCPDSHTAAQLLMERGFENVVVFIDGFPGWIENGYPVETP